MSPLPAPAADSPTPRQESRQRRRERDPAGYRAGRSAARKRRLHRQREQVFDHYGRLCACCGSAERLTIDHVRGDGAKHRRAIGKRSGMPTYHWLVAHGFPGGFQTLCKPCNGSKANQSACRIDHTQERDADAATVTLAA